MKTLKLGKAAGPDSINNRPVKELAQPLSFSLSDIINLSTGMCPSILKLANVTPINKTDDPSDVFNYIYRSRKENPQKLTQLSSKSHPRHLVRKRTAQKDITIDTTSDSQVNSNFPNRWSPASLTFNNYFYLFLYLYIT